MEQIKAILFDLDGVLVDMPDAHYEALNRALEPYGVKIEAEEHRSFFNGMPSRKKLEVLELQGRLPTGLRELINEQKQHYTRELIPKYCKPNKKKIAMLEKLKELNFKLACCSNSTKDSLHYMLKSAGLLHYFDHVIGNDEVSSPKPHPEIYLVSFDKLGVKPQECIIIEDSPYGVTAAKSSGAHVIEVAGYDQVTLDLFDPALLTFNTKKS